MTLKVVDDEEWPVPYLVSLESLEVHGQRIVQGGGRGTVVCYIDIRFPSSLDDKKVFNLR